MSVDYSLFHEVGRLHGQTADYHLIYLTRMRALHLRRFKKLTEGMAIGSSVSSASTSSSKFSRVTHGTRYVRFRFVGGHFIATSTI